MKIKSEALVTVPMAALSYLLTKPRKHSRIDYALNVLRGRPLIYRARFDGGTIRVDKPHTIIAETTVTRPAS